MRCERRATWPKSGASSVAKSANTTISPRQGGRRWRSCVQKSANWWAKCWQKGREKIGSDGAHGRTILHEHRVCRANGLDEHGLIYSAKTERRAMRHCTMSRTWTVVFVTTVLGLVWFSVNRAAEPTPDASPPAWPAALSA